MLNQLIQWILIIFIYNGRFLPLYLEDIVFLLIFASKKN